MLTCNDDTSNSIGDDLSVNDLYVISAKNHALLMNAKRMLEDAKSIQKEYEDLKVKLARASDVRMRISDEVDHIRSFAKLVDREDAEYRDKRTAFLESQIEEPIALIFPNQNFRASITTKPFRNKLRVSLKLKDKFGRVCKPKMGEGKFCQQLISFAGSTSVAKSYGVDKVFTDEAFNASSPENLTKVGVLLGDLLADGKQIILVEQEDIIYKDLARREIRIDIDPVTGDVLPLQITDF